MKFIIYIIVCVYSGSFLFHQRTIFDGFGDIRIGKTEADIFNALHVKRAEIVEGSGETMQQFRKSVYQSVVHVQYNASSRLANEKAMQRGRHSYVGDTTASPEAYLYQCVWLDEYFIPKYEFDGITLNGFCLIFYENKLVKIAFNTSESYCGIDSVADYFQKKYSDCLYYTYEQWDTDACGEYPRYSSWNWPKKDSNAAIKVSWIFDDKCRSFGHRCESQFDMTDQNFLKKMVSFCPDIKY